MRKKKIIIKVKEAKRRNPIARVLCTDSRFKTKRFKNKKKTRILPYDTIHNQEP